MFQKIYDYVMERLYILLLWAVDAVCGPADE